MLAMALGKKKMTPPGIKTEATTSGGTMPQKFILGLSATGGQLIAPPNSYGRSGDTPNANLVYVVALSVVPGCTLNRVIVDDAWITAGAASEDGFGWQAGGDYEGLIWVDYRDGSQTAAHAGLITSFGADPDRPWLADMVGPGTCYAVMRFAYSREHFNGLPQCRFEMMGITDNLMMVNQGLHLRERDSGDFDWTPGDLIPWTPSAPVTTPPAPRDVPGFAASSAVVVDASSSARRPAIDLSWLPGRASDAHGGL